jgi:hypothetical protein
MSADVYLLPLQPDEDFESAMQLLEALENRTVEVESGFDVRPLHLELMKREPRYERVSVNYAGTAKLGGIAGETASESHDYVILQGRSESDQALSGFVFHRTHITIEDRQGTARDKWAATLI